MKRNKFILAAFAALALGACSNDHEAEMRSTFPEDGIIRITAGVNKLATRAGATTDGIDQLGLYIDSQNDNYDYTNVLIQKNASGSWSSGSTLMLWADNTSAVQATAYFPYTLYENVASDPVTAFNAQVYTDQSNESRYTNSDFVYESKSVNPSTDLDSDGRISFTLTHAFSRLDMSLTMGSTVPAGATIKSVKVLGVAMAATLNMPTGVLTPKMGYYALSAYPMTAQVEGATPAVYSVILIPQTVEAEQMSVMITLTEEGTDKNYIFTVETGQTFTGNTKYTTNIQVGPDNTPVVIKSDTGLSGWEGNTNENKTTD